MRQSSCEISVTSKQVIGILSGLAIVAASRNGNRLYEDLAQKIQKICATARDYHEGGEPYQGRGVKYSL